MIDTHCHLYVDEFKDDLEKVILAARNVGVKKFFMPAIDSYTTQEMLNIEEQYPGVCYSMIGLHPCSVTKDYRIELDKVEALLNSRKFAAIGETGLDFYWDKTHSDEQYKALDIQIGWALQYNIPIVLHTRNATRETIEVIKSYKGKNLTGIFHCFGGTKEEAADIIKAGFLLGIGGVITYKNSGLAEIIQDIDLKHLVLETDAPYLSPVPFRGKRNESAYLKFIAEKIATVKGISPETVVEGTTRNALEVFKQL